MHYISKLRIMLLLLLLTGGLSLAAQEPEEDDSEYVEDDNENAEDSEEATEQEHDYYVESWNYKAIVHENNTWDVTETIVVNFMQPHHGIFLYRPQVFVDKHKLEGKGSVPFTYALDIENVKVSGYRFETSTESDAQNSYVIRIGDEDKTLTGVHEYEVSYRIVYPDDRASDCDRLFHSVIGDGWPTLIKKFTFDIKFDKPLPESALEDCYVYSGPWGRNSDGLGIAEYCYISEDGIGGSIENLPGRNAITFYATLPDGFYVGTKAVGNTFSYILYILTVAIGVLLLFRFLTTRQRSPLRTVEFYPPEGISSAEVGTIIDESADLSDLTSLIPWFAEKGYLTITEEPDYKGRTGKHADIRLDKKNPLPDDAPAYQREFMTALFRSKETVRLKTLGDRHSQIGRALDSLRKTFTGERELSTTQNGGMTFLFYILFAITMCTFSAISSFDTDALGCAVGLALFLAPAIFFRYNSACKSSFKKKKGVKSAIGTIALAAFSLGFFNQFYTEQDSIWSPFMGEALIVLAFIIAFLSTKIHRDTDYKIDMVGRLQGLEDFIKTAELQQLKALVDETPEYFYKILPYAMVFGLTDKWVKQFSHIDFEKPDWYTSSDATAYGLMNGHHLASRIADSFNSQISSAVRSSSHDPSSGSSGSSGGGGGFSGGGGGGGGGGAW